MAIEYLSPSPPARSCILCYKQTSANVFTDGDPFIMVRLKRWFTSESWTFYSPVPKPSHSLVRGDLIEPRFFILYFTRLLISFFKVTLSLSIKVQLSGVVESLKRPIQKRKFKFLTRKSEGKKDVRFSLFPGKPSNTGSRSKYCKLY